MTKIPESLRKPGLFYFDNCISFPVQTVSAQRKVVGYSLIFSCKYAEPANVGCPAYFFRLP